MKGSFKVIIFYVILIAVLVISITSILGNSNNKEYSYGEIVEMFKNEEITKCTVGNDNVLVLVNTEGKKGSNKNFRFFRSQGWLTEFYSEFI